MAIFKIPAKLIMSEYLNMQSDYTFFVYGLVFIILSAICAVRCKNRKTHAAWLLLGMFGLMHGIGAWLDMVVISIGNSFAFISLRLGLTLVSLLFLVGFGIQPEYRAENTDKRLIMISFLILAISDMTDDLNLPDFCFQIFRLVLAILTVYAVWQDYSRLRIRNRCLTEISLGIILLAGWIITETVGYRNEIENKDYLLIRTEIAAASLNIGRIKSLSGSAADTDTPAHVRLTEQLGKIREANPDCRYVYLMEIKEGNIIFLADSDPYGSKDFEPPGQIYYKASSAVKNMFSKGRSLIEGPLPDPWGILWVRGLVPITDPQSHKVIAMLGMDIDAADWGIAIARHRLIPILITLLIITIVLVFFAAQQKLYRSRRDWKDIFEAVGHPMIVMDVQHNILAANCATVKAIGMPYQNILGKKCYEIFHNSDHPPKNCPMKTLLKSGGLNPVEMEMEAAGNKAFMVFCTPISDDEGNIVRIIHVATDITQRKRMEEKLRESEERYRLLFERSPIGIFHYDTDFILTDCNRQFEKIIQSSREKLQGLDMNMLNDQSVVPALKKALEGIDGFYEGFYHATTGHAEIWVSMRTAPLSDSNNHICGGVGIVEDITRRKQMEQAILAAKEAAESASRAKSRFISHVSHELRTPLNGIMGYAQLLGWNNKGLNSKQIGQIRMIHRCGEYLMVMINDILDFSKIEAEKLEIESSEINFSEFLQITISIAEVQASQKGLSFVYEPCSELPCWILGDEKRLRQILLNFFSNAVKYTESGKVIFRVISSSPSDTDNCFRCRFEVEDTGIGIPPDQLERIFEPFHQIGNTHQGTGLGLTITKNLIGKMDGKLYISSIEGKGSVFGFEMQFPIVSRECIRLEPKTIQPDYLEIPKFRVPESEALKRFLVLVNSGDVAVIQQYAALYQNADPEFASFWEMIYTFAQNLQLKKIKRLLRQYTENVE